MKPLVSAFALALLLAGTASASAQGPATPGDAAFLATTVSVSAAGEAHVAPDMATISLGVSTVGATAAEAMSANAAQMQSIFAALKAAGIAEADIQTAGLNLNPQYAYEDQEAPKLTGYEAAHMLTVTVHDLETLGATVDAVVSSGANQVNGITFGLDDDAAATAEARRAAVSALQDKAAFYAEALGLKVARLVNLTEGVAPSFPVTVAFRAEQSATSVAPGQIVVRVDATAVYELAK
jgi:uncharacterized protein YggE